MDSKYVIWDSAIVDGACAVQGLNGVDKVIELKKGISRKDGFPTDASFSMNPDFPDDTLLVDNLINTEMLIVVSKKLKALVESKRPNSVEYLPVKIIDHKGKTASRDYFILNPIDPPDCLDMKASQAKLNPINKQLVDKVEKLVLREEALPKDRLVLRPKGFYKVTLVRRDLAEAMDAAGFAGNRWISLSDYGR